MTDTGIPALDIALAQVSTVLDAVTGSGSDTELVAVLTRCEDLVRRADRATVAATAALERRGVFAAHGYRSPAAALADLLGCERFEARRRVVAAEQVTPRIGLDGSTLPARLPATATAFADGRASLRHVDAVAKVLGSPSAARLTPEAWSGAEEQIAARTGEYTPSELHAWATALVETLDQDGAEPDDRPPAQVNELHLTRLASGGGKIKGRIDDAAMFDAIATAVDAHARPLTGDDDRSAGERQAEALADVCGYVLDHGDVPECGGHRPHVNVLVRLDDLQNRASAACLDFGGVTAPAGLRALCCDAGVVPVVMNGAGQPLDVGRATRTIPDGLRRAVAARDQGCAHPGCGRPPSWCECHHLIPWECDGETKLSNLAMLCRAHHRQIHSTEWICRIRDGLPEFIPPAFIDPLRTPRRKALPALVGVQG